MFILFYFILFYIYFIVCSLFLPHFICLILVSTQILYEKWHDKENYNSTYEIVQMGLLWY